MTPGFGCSCMFPFTVRLLVLIYLMSASPVPEYHAAHARGVDWLACIILVYLRVDEQLCRLDDLGAILYTWTNLPSKYIRLCYAS